MHGCLSKHIIRIRDMISKSLKGKAYPHLISFAKASKTFYLKEVKFRVFEGKFLGCCLYKSFPFNIYCALKLHTFNLHLVKIGPGFGQIWLGLAEKLSTFIFVLCILLYLPELRLKMVDSTDLQMTINHFLQSVLFLFLNTKKALCLHLF